jgi:hypothetical protein
MIEARNIRMVRDRRKLQKILAENPEEKKLLKR